MKRSILFVFISVFMFSIFGCSNQVKNTSFISDVTTLDIEKNTGTDRFEQMKKISDKETINKVLSILRNANWDNAEVSMARPPDFKINNLYEIWISPKKDRLEVVMDGKSRYTQLSKKDSQLLFKIITGKQLSEGNL